MGKQLIQKIDLLFNDKNVASIPIDFLAEDAPTIRNEKTKLPQKLKFDKQQFKSLKLSDCLNKILCSPNVADKKWIWDQYDHTVMGDTIQTRRRCWCCKNYVHQKAVAASVDSASQLLSHPLTGENKLYAKVGKLISVGGKPIVITNCLNF